MKDKEVKNDKWDRNFCEFIIDCQQVEDLLRSKIEICAIEINLLLIRDKITKIRYKLDKKSLDGANMGQLIKELSRFVNDNELISRLMELKKIRNNIVHAIFIQSIEESSKLKISDDDLNKFMTKTLNKKINTGLKLSRSCIDKLNKVFDKLRSI
jgi:hypothetical protein